MLLLARLNKSSKSGKLSQNQRCSLMTGSSMTGSEMFNCSHSLTCLCCNRVDHSKHTEIYKQCQREGKIELVFFNINKLLILFSVWQKTNQRFQSQDTHSSHFSHISHISSHVLIKFLIQIFYSICI